MNQTIYCRLEEKRKQYLLAKQTLPLFIELSQKRLELENKKTALQKKREQFSFYQPNSLQKRAELKAFLKCLNQEISHLDHQLDQIEEIDEEGVKKMEKELLQQLCLHYSNEYQKQNHSWQALQLTSLIKEELNQLCTFIQEMIMHLNVIKEARLLIKKRGLFSYVFGASPNLIIEKQLLMMADLISKQSVLLTSLEDKKSVYSSIFSFDLFQQTLQNLKVECVKSWGFSHLEQKIFPYEQQLHHFWEKISLLIEQLENDIEKNQQLLSQWLIDLKLA